MLQHGRLGDHVRSPASRAGLAKRRLCARASRAAWLAISWLPPESAVPPCSPLRARVSGWTSGTTSPSRGSGASHGRPHHRSGRRHRAPRPHRVPSRRRLGTHKTAWRPRLALGAVLHPRHVEAAQDRARRLFGALIVSDVRGLSTRPVQIVPAPARWGHRRRLALDVYTDGPGTLPIEDLRKLSYPLGDSVLLRLVLDVCGWNTDRFCLCEPPAALAARWPGSVTWACDRLCTRDRVRCLRVGRCAQPIGVATRQGGPGRSLPDAVSRLCQQWDTAGAASPSHAAGGGGRRPALCV